MRVSKPEYQGPISLPRTFVSAVLIGQGEGCCVGGSLHFAAAAFVAVCSPQALRALLCKTAAGIYHQVDLASILMTLVVQWLCFASSFAAAAAADLLHSFAGLLQLLAVFDADMVCSTDFFIKTLPRIMDDRVSLVLTPQAYHNYDSATDIFNHSAFAYWTMMVPGEDAWGHIVCTGKLSHPTPTHPL